MSCWTLCLTGALGRMGEGCRWRRSELGWVVGWGGMKRTQAAGACSTFLRCCQHSLLSNYLSVKTCTKPHFTSKLKGSNQEKLLGDVSETDGSTFRFTLGHNMSWNGYFSKEWVKFVDAHMRSVAVWESGAWFKQQSIFCQGYGQVG